MTAVKSYTTGVFLQNPQGGGFFFSVIFSRASKNKPPPPGGFRDFQALGFVSAAEITMIKENRFLD